jgi:hypothetical protein
MHMKRTYLMLGALLILAFLLLAACAPSETPTPVTVKETVVVEITPEAVETAVEVPFFEEWESSGHADTEADAFRHWDEDDPPEIPTDCAKCHSEAGYHDFLGLDGSEAGVVDNPVPPNGGVTCVTCHNDVTLVKSFVVMPSGIELTGLGSEATCMECHQGRESKVSVDAAIEEAGVDDDSVSEDLGFRNVHFYPAAATKYGTEAKGGYEYDGKSYDAFFTHVEGYETCQDCHNTHTLEVKVTECTVCHTDVSTVEDVRNIRMVGSLTDFDGDGNIEEGITAEIEGLQAMLYQALQSYASEVAGAPVVYDSAAYPYFFNDTNEDGETGEDEANFGNRFAGWTPRLLRAAYNYQLSQKDPGAYAHGGKYIIQLLYDSIEDLNTAIASPVDLSTANRIDDGHFAGSEEAFRHWDEDEPPVVPGACSKCHTAAGLPLFASQVTLIPEPTVDEIAGVATAQEPSNGFLCSTCHTDAETYELYVFETVTFPSGAKLDTGDPDSNLCMNCHQGNSYSGAVDAAIEGIPADSVSEDLGFINIHFFAAGATLFGNESQGAYQYSGKTYAGRNVHVERFDTCVECHSTHQLEVKAEECGACHVGVSSVNDLAGIRIREDDIDGDGDTEEGIASEIEAMNETLYACMQDYAANTAGTPLVYSSSAYPYFFIDTNGDGVPDPDETNYGNQYNTWTPRLLQAAYNLQYASKDPGAYTHNPDYVIQVLYDSIQDICGSASGLTRP